jgi:hypothetical protein
MSFMRDKAVDATKTCVAVDIFINSTRGFRGKMSRRSLTLRAPLATNDVKIVAKGLL